MTRRAAGSIGLALGLLWLLAAAGLGSVAAAASPAPPAGPPYPAAVTGQRVYDFAGIFSPDAIVRAEARIRTIEERTGAQIAVYTQVKPLSDDLNKANADAAALIDQWGVGRKGFDDGLVILFDMQDNLAHGQVSLYAGSGFRAAFLSDSERQAIFDDDMLPYLRSANFDSALDTAIAKIDAAATPEHAAELERARQINAIVSVGSLMLGLLLCLWAFLAWVRYGRDPVYLDDSSVLMPAPPAELTPAMATLLMDDLTGDRTVTAGLVDLASKGCIAFHLEPQADDGDTTGISFLKSYDGPLARPEEQLLGQIEHQAEKHGGGYIKPKQMWHLLGDFGVFKDSIETAAVKRGWLVSRPSQVTLRWAVIGSLELAAVFLTGLFWLITEASALFLVSVSLVVAGLFTITLSRFMAARTRQGAMLFAMLSAYKRTLKLTMAKAESMNEVVAAKALPWIETPDEAMAWGIALGLNNEVQAVLARSAVPEFERSAGAAPAWHPTWWVYGAAGGAAVGGATHHDGGSPGLFSSGPLPDPGAIFASLHSITNASSPATSSGSSGSSSWSSGGSFGGGGSSGGGGAGGGF